MIEKKGIVELVAVVVELCSTLESTQSFKKKDFIIKTQKLLSLLYLKAALLADSSESEETGEQFVTEQDWELIRRNAETILGTHDNRIEILEPDKYSSSEYVETYISECFADIYQDARNFAELCKNASDENLTTATQEFLMNFKLYWGTRVLAILTEFHNILYASDTTIDDDNE